MGGRRQLWHWAPGLIAAALAGCATQAQERAHAYNQDGVYLYQQREYAAARDSFQAALALTPDDETLRYNLAECWAHLGDYGQAEQYYRQCLQQTPEHHECRYELVLALARQGRREEAAEAVDRWLKLQPRLAIAYAADGWLWHRAGDLPRAQARLQQALELDPHEPHALAEMGEVYEEMQRPDRAVALYEKVLGQNPNQADVRRRLNVLLAKGAPRPRPD